MEIQIRIKELVLYGFNYHDHRRISASVERELARLIKKHGVPEAATQRHEFRNMDAGSFKVPRDMNPRLIGAEIARSVYKGLNDNRI
jgi:hypothetical protein